MISLIPTIREFAGEYRFLSNFYPSPFSITTPEDGVFLFATVEHAYQAFKTLNADMFMHVMSAATPGEAKRRGQRVNIRRDWEEIKERVMLSCVRAKFNQNPDLALLLIETHPMELIEGNSWNDTYWGMCKGRGLNRLGAILMAVRAELIAAQSIEEDDG